MACSCSLSNRLESQCESFETRVIQQRLSDGVDWYDAFEFEGIAVSAVALQKAIDGQSTTDDYKIIASALAADDIFTLSQFDDYAFGYGGNDNLYGGEGTDSLDGGNRNDTVVGGDGIDVLMGSAGADVLEGGSDNEQLFGGGNDRLNGEWRC